MSRDALIRALALHASHELSPAAARAVVDALYPSQPVDHARWPAQDFGDYVIRAEPWRDTDELYVLHANFHEELGEPSDVDATRLNELQRAGKLLTVAARREGVLVGLLRCFITKHHRTGVLSGRDDMFFIGREHRGGMLAVAMARYTEACLADLGVARAELTLREANGMHRMGAFMGYSPQARVMVKSLVAN